MTLQSKIFWTVMTFALLISLYCLYYPYNPDGSRRRRMTFASSDNLNNIANAHSLYHAEVMPEPALLSKIVDGDTIVWNGEYR